MNSIYLGTNKAHGKSLSLFKKSILSVLFLIGTFVTAQQSVSGTVVDPSGVPLPGLMLLSKELIREHQQILTEIFRFKLLKLMY